MSAYDDLMRYVRETQALGAVAGRLGWDQETMMPRDAAPQRAEEMAALESVLHARRSAPQIAEWMSRLEGASVSADQKAQLRHIRRSYDRATKVPADLAAELARLTSSAQGIWAEARAADDFAAFAPTLTEVLVRKREEGEALADGGHVYDAMLQDYEPGTSEKELEAMFGALRPELSALRVQVLEAAPAPT